METKRKFVKINNDKYAFVTENDRVKTTQEISKKTAFEDYNEVMRNKSQLLSNIQTLNKKLKSYPDVVDEKVKEFLELANRAAELSEKVKTESQRKDLEYNLDLINQQIKDMEGVIPELKRKTRS